MKTESVISIVVPVYQVEQYLEQCLDSIINQTYESLEIILVDDGSTDSSGIICDNYARIDSRIKVIHKSNGGLVSARKAAMELCTGEYLAYVDSDDWLELDMYEKMMNEMQETCADVVICAHYHNCRGVEEIVTNYVNAGVYCGTMLEEELYSRMLYEPKIGYWGISPACWDKLMKLDNVKGHQMKVDERIWDGEDHAFIYSVLLEAKRISVMSNPLYHHRIREGSVAVGYDARSFERFSYLFNQMKESFSKSKYWKILKVQFEKEMRWFVLKHIQAELEVAPYDERTMMRAFLFPFSLIEKGSDIILYGAGDVGQTFFRQIQTSDYCNVIMWVDKNYENFDSQYGIKSPNEIPIDVDEKIVVAVLKESTFRSIKADICDIIGEKGNIVWQNPLVELI